MAKTVIFLTLAAILSLAGIGSVFAQQSDPATDAELVKAAAFPYAIERFVETHSDFNLTPLLEVLKVKSIYDGTTPRVDCGGYADARHTCLSELMTVVSPPQIILILDNRDMDFEVVLRFLGSGPPEESPTWSYAGYYSPYIKYFSPEHRIVMFGNDPYLALTSQGQAGSGLSSTLEDWIDLAGSKLEPVFSYSTEGHLVASSGRFSREVTGSVGRLDIGPPQSITIHYQVDFSVEPPPYERRLATGHRMDDIVYSRGKDGKFSLDEKRSSTSAAQIEALYQNLDSKISNEKYLRYALKSLIEIAKGEFGDESRAWLREFLGRCSDTSEKKQISDILNDPSQYHKAP